MPEKRRDALATTLGLLTFLGGVALIVTAFIFAREMFAVPPGEAIEVSGGETININATVAAAFGVLLKVLLLIVMAGIGSILANRGIRLYAQGNPGLLPTKPEREKPEDEASEDKPKK
ncbi:MAG: hypothetical protein IH944_07600 [Armatimonadetes bacterium]|nr:hypothetical protein [Armatimonadota bacterium]